MSARVTSTRSPRQPAPAAAGQKEPWPEQVASFVGFFIYLLILKSFFLPLFIIPTGSMAETLYGAHAMHTCPNCGIDYPVSCDAEGNAPPVIMCPNCHWEQFTHRPHGPGAPRIETGELLTQPLRATAGDRIFVHGWPYAPPFANIPLLGPKRWDVAVFKVPTDGETNYIKRLIGLPNDTIELIDGDVFVDGAIARKTPSAQTSLWFRYYDQDHPPREPSTRQGYHPRWVALEGGGAWQDLGGRRPRFDGLGQERSEIQFVTEPGPTRKPGHVNDVYGYNGTYQQNNIVRDIRLSAEVTLEEGAGYVELSTTKHDERFNAQLHTDGRLTLEHERINGHESSGRAVLAETTGIATSQPVLLTLSNVDYVVSVAIDGQTVLQSTPEQYAITPENARRLSTRRDYPIIRCAAADVRVALRHLLIERDVYYTNPRLRNSHGRETDPGYGTQGRPITLGPSEYYLLGDNSPNSQDARLSFARGDRDPVGPHLKQAEREGHYQHGTVPADQMLGRAFFVYWPGFMPLSPRGPNFLPDLGRARWVR